MAIGSNRSPWGNCIQLMPRSFGNMADWPQDQAAAVRHYQRAAELGNVEAEALLGVVYERGWAGVPRDLNRAVAWYQKAARQGHAGAELNLGLLYEKGEGVPNDPGRARSLTEAAAKQGLAPAQRKLAELQQGQKSAPGTDLWEEGKKRYKSGGRSTCLVTLRNAPRTARSSKRR